MKKTNDQNPMDDIQLTRLKKLIQSAVKDKLQEGPIFDGKECLSDKDIIDYAENTLSKEDRDRVIAHMTACMPCLVKTENLYDKLNPPPDLQQYVDQLKQRTKANFLNDDIQYEDRVHQINLKLAPIVAEYKDIDDPEDCMDLIQSNPMLVTLSNNQTTTMTGFPSPLMNLEITINSAEGTITVRNKDKIDVELIHNQRITAPLAKNTHLDQILSMFDCFFIEGVYYVFPEIVENKVLSISFHYISAIPEVTSTSISDQQPILLYKMMMSIVVALKLINSQKRYMAAVSVCLIILCAFPLFKGIYSPKDPLSVLVNQSYQTAIKNDFIFQYDRVPFHWSKEKFYFSSKLKLSLDQRAFAAGLWSGKQDIMKKKIDSKPSPFMVPDSSDTSRNSVDQWKETQQAYYYWLGRWCYVVKNTMISGEKLSQDFLLNQIQVIENFKKQIHQQEQPFEKQKILTFLNHTLNYFNNARKSEPDQTICKEQIKRVEKFIRQLIPE